MKITDDIKYIGVDDHDIDLFEGQYDVPEGMAYNSYIIIDDRLPSWIRWTGISRQSGWTT